MLFSNPKLNKANENRVNMVGLFKKDGTELNYCHYERQSVKLELELMDGEPYLINTNKFEFNNIQHDHSPLMAIVFDKNGKEVILFKIRHRVGKGDGLTWNINTLNIRLSNLSGENYIHRSIFFDY